MYQWWVERNANELHEASPNERSEKDIESNSQGQENRYGDHLQYQIEAEMSKA